MIPKVKLRVKVTCLDGSCFFGFLHVDEGYRLLDFINEAKKKFIALTEVRFKVSKKDFFKLYLNSRTKKETIFLNKESIKWIEEID